MGIGTLIVLVLRALTGWTIAIDVDAVLIALAVSAATGLVCSLVPAWRASLVMPARTLAAG